MRVFVRMLVCMFRMGMVTRMSLCVRMRMRPVGMAVVFVRVFGVGVLRMRMGLMRLRAVRVGLVAVRLRSVHMPWFRLASDEHIYFCPGESATDDLPLLQARAHMERGAGLFKNGKGNTRVHQSAQQHVAAYAGKTLKISNSHRM